MQEHERAAKAISDEYGFEKPIKTPKGKSQPDGQSAETSQPQRPQEAQSEIVNKTSKPQTDREEQRKQKLFDLIKPFDTSIQIPPREFIGGLFPRGKTSMIAGAPGVGKSWFGEKFFADLSIGGEKDSEGRDGAIFGGIGYENQPRKCLYFAGELDSEEMTRRAQDARMTIDKRYCAIIDLGESTEAEINLALNQKDGQKNILDLVEHYQPEILCVDSLTSFFDDDESQKKEINKVLTFLGQTARKYNMAVVVIHHVRKRLASEQGKPLTLDDVVGSGVIGRLISVVLGVEYDRNIEAVKVTPLKSWFKKFKPFAYKIKSGLYDSVKIEIDTDLKEEATINNLVKSAAQPDTKTAILLFLKGRGENGASIQEINDAINGSTNTTSQQLKRMADNGEIIRLKRGIYAAETPTNTETPNEREKENENDIGISF